MKLMIRAIGAFLFTCLCVLNCTAQQSIEGDWIGGYQVTNGQWVIFRARLKREPEGMTGTIEVRALDGATTSLTLTKISTDSTRIHLEAAKDSNALTLDGLLKDGMIKGSFQQGELRGSFELLRVTNAAPKLFDEYVGSYDLGSGNFISIGRTISMSRQATVGPDMRLSPDMRIGFVERLSGRRGNLTAISDSAFFAGPALGLAYPQDVTVTFIRNNQGQVTALKWKSGKAPEKLAKKTAIREEEVKFQSGANRIAGTLLLPPTKALHPVVVMAHGSTPLIRYYHGADPYMYPVYGVSARPNSQFVDRNE